MRMNFMVSSKSFTTDGENREEIPFMEMLRDVQKIAITGSMATIYGPYKGLEITTELSDKAIRRLNDIYSAIISCDEHGAINVSKFMLEYGSDDLIKDILKRTVRNLKKEADQIP